MSIVLAAVLAVLPASAPQDFGRLRHVLPDPFTVQRRCATTRVLGVRDLVGDLDGDGDLDLLVSQKDVFGQATFAVFENDGRGLFTTVPDPTLAGPEIGSRVADLNGDGDPDVLAVTNLSLHPYLNDGAGDFTDGGALPVFLDGQLCEPLELADFDGDGTPDLYVGKGFSQLTQGLDTLLWNDGAGGFAEDPSPLPSRVSNGLPTAIDGDGDGDPDLVRSGEYLRNEPAGFVSVPGALPAGVVAGIPADREGDGDLDLLARVSTGPSGETCWSWVVNDGSGTFVTDLSQVLCVDDADLADWSGDGLLDLVGSGPVVNGSWLSGVYLAVGDGTGGFATSPALSPVPGTAGTHFDGLSLGDLDGDGDGDLVLNAISTAPFAFEPDHVLWQHAGPTFEVALRAPESVQIADAIQLADVDGDQRLDVLTSLEGTLHVLLNDGTGVVATPDVAAAGSPLVTRPFAGATVGFHAFDLGGDGDADLLSLSSDGGPVELRLLESQGASGFVDASDRLPTIPLLGTITRFAPVSGDLDGEGSLDLLIPTTNTSGSYDELLFLGDGLGGFTDGTALLPAGDLGQEARLGDLDGDGALDAVFRRNATVTPYGNPGTGALAAGPTTIPDGNQDHALADLDLDGFLDVAVTRELSVRVYANDGTGVSSLPALWSQALPSAFGTRLIAPDLDGDGRPDLVSSRPAYFRNASTGVFEDRTANLAHFTPDGFAPAPLDDPLAAGDLDADGDMDVVVAGEARVHWNLERQLASRYDPVLGRPLVLDLFAQPRTSWALLGSLRTGRLATGFGELLLLPKIELVGTGQLEAAGRAAVAVPVPPDPTLVGLDVFWQALSGAPLRLGNLERTTLLLP